MLVVMHGVHGGGKSLIARILSEDYGLKLVTTDAAEIFPEVVSFSPELRQMVYSGSGLLGYTKALELSRKGERVVLDFGPRHTIPYAKWFLREDKEAQKFIQEHILNAVAFLEERLGKERVLNVFLIIKEDPSIILERIRRRGREGFLREEEDGEYLAFIDREMKRLATNMKEDGHRVLEIPADAPLLEKLEMLVEEMRGE